VKSSTKWLWSAGALAVLLLVPEVALRIAGFEYRSGVRFGFPDPQTMASFKTDERLFWKLKTPAESGSARGDTAGNSRGFPGPDPAIPKPADAYRALFLGDSCTFQGYPWLAAERMRALAIPEGKRAESVSMAVPGYTSFQGRRAAEAYGLEVEPDVVFVFFGWNDHWAAYREIDSKKTLSPAHGALARCAAVVLERSRLAQAAAWLSTHVVHVERPLELPRVLPDEYRANLDAIREVFAPRKIPVVFLTAPTTFYRLGVPPKLVEDHFAASAEEAIRLHRAYNAIVREVAASSGAILLDLEAECDAAPELPSWFLKDGVHFSPAGREWIAGRIATLVRERVLAQ
jgi:lysophospholipase L1-like esterase